MAVTIQTDGLDALGQMLNALGERAPAAASAGLYKGAGVVADAFTQATGKIVSEPFHYLARPDLTGTKRYASPEEKAALVGKTGIAKFNKSPDAVDTLVGLQDAGYANVAGKQKAVALIARSINSGTSFMHKQPVYRKAGSSSKNAAEQAIVAEIERQLNEITKG